MLIKSDDNYCGFPKGHIEKCETEKETALRETWKETSIKATMMALDKRLHIRWEMEKQNQLSIS